MNLTRRMALIATISLAISCAAQSPASTTDSRVAGTVVDALTGQPLVDATVVLAPISARQQEETVRSGSDGRFLFSNLAPGKYSLGAKRRGYALQGYNQHEFFSTAIAVGAGLDSEHILFRLHPDASIRGTITDEQNEPAQNIRVRLFGLRMENGESSVRPVSQGMTDDRGQYSFPHLQEGTYYVEASGRPWYSDNLGFMRQTQLQVTDPETKARIEQEASKLDFVYPPTFYSGALSSADATPIRLSPGDNVTADMSLQPVRSLYIHVPAATNVQNPVDQGTLRRIRANAQNVRLFQQIFGDTMDDNAMQSVFPEPDGSYDIGGIAPGRYRIEINTPGDPKAPSTSLDVDLTGSIDLPSSPGIQLAHVDGTMWLSGKPVEHGVVEMRTADGSKGYAAQVQKGQFQFEQAVPPGRYQIAILAMSNDNVYLSDLKATGAKVNERSVQVGAGANVTLAIFASEGIGRIDGVAKLNGKPIGGVMILLVPDDFVHDSRLVRRDQSDSDGTFTLPHAVPGRYRLLAIEDGWKIAWANPKVLQPYLANARGYTIQPNQKLQVTVDVQQAK